MIAIVGQSDGHVHRPRIAGGLQLVHSIEMMKDLPGVLEVLEVGRDPHSLFRGHGRLSDPY
jgi:hypothetical protein